MQQPELLLIDEPVAGMTEKETKYLKFIEGNFS